MSETAGGDHKPRKYKKNREMFGAIRSLKSGRFQASYIGPDGARHTAPHTFDARIDARAYLTAERARINAGAWESRDQAKERTEAERKQAEARRFLTYAEAWIETRLAKKGQKSEPLRPKTKAEYRRYLQKGLSTFKDEPLVNITAERVREWHNKRTKEAGATAAGNEARMLRALMTRAVEDGILARNPVDAHLARTVTGKAFRPPTSGELATLIAEMPDELRFAIQIAAHGGLRLSEWRALRRKDVTISKEGRASVSVTRQAHYVQGEGWHVGPPKSAAGVRVVRLPSALTPALQDHLTEHVGAFPDSLIFPAASASSEFLSDRQFMRAWDKARMAAGVRRELFDASGEPYKPRKFEADVREHDLRGYAATRLAEAGATLREIQLFLGDSTPSAALRYMHADRDRLADLIDRIPMPEQSPAPVARIRQA